MPSRYNPIHILTKDTPYISPARASYGVSLASSSCDPCRTFAPHCMTHRAIIITELKNLELELEL